jgi:hypothetical protein
VLKKQSERLQDAHSTFQKRILSLETVKEVSVQLESRVAQLTSQHAAVRGNLDQARLESTELRVHGLIQLSLLS